MIKMKTFRDSSPYILGYVAYLVYYIALVQLIWLGIFFIFHSYPSFLSNSFQMSLGLGFINLSPGSGLNLFINYLCFLASTKWITLPIIKRSQNISTKTERKSLVLEWFLFSIFVFLYGNLPMAFLPVFPITKEIQNIISFVWIAIIGYAIYKDVVVSFAFSPAEKELVNKNDTQTKIA